MMRLSFSLFVALAAAACPEPGGGPGGIEGEGEGEGDGKLAVERAGDTVVEAVGVSAPTGIALTLRADGRFAVAFARSPSDAPPVTCQLFGGGTVTEDRVSIVVADEELDGNVRIRVVDDVPPLPGAPSVAIDVDPASDALLVAYMGGAPAQGACQASDLMLAVESGAGFQIRTVTDQPGTITPCRDTAANQPFCDRGDVQGREPSIAVHGDGTIVIGYVDQHFGFADKDIFGADMEIARGTAASQQTESIATESGSGYRNTVALTADGRVIAGYATIGTGIFDDGNGGTVTISPGIYAAIEQEDGTFKEKALLARGATSGRVAAAFHPALGAAVAFRDDNGSQLLLYTSFDDGETWRAAAIEQSQGTGRNPRLGFLSDGTLVAAYSHCKDGAGGGDLCNAEQDGVRISLRPPGETSFSKFTFRGDDEDQDGIGADMRIAADDTIVVSSFNASTARIVVERFRVTR
jgi:hypothetical protein